VTFGFATFFLGFFLATGFFLAAVFFFFGAGFFFLAAGFCFLAAGFFFLAAGFFFFAVVFFVVVDFRVFVAVAYSRAQKSTVDSGEMGPPRTGVAVNWRAFGANIRVERVRRRSVFGKLPDWARREVARRRRADTADMPLTVGIIAAERLREQTAIQWGSRRKDRGLRAATDTHREAGEMKWSWDGEGRGEICVSLMWAAAPFVWRLRNCLVQFPTSGW